MLATDATSSSLAHEKHSNTWSAPSNPVSSAKAVSPGRLRLGCTSHPWHHSIHSRVKRRPLESRYSRGAFHSETSDPFWVSNCSLCKSATNSISSRRSCRNKASPPVKAKLATPISHSFASVCFHCSVVSSGPLSYCPPTRYQGQEQKTQSWLQCSVTSRTAVVGRKDGARRDCPGFIPAGPSSVRANAATGLSGALHPPANPPPHPCPKRNRAESRGPAP